MSPSPGAAQHVVVGTVVTGDRRGRLLGFPTANIVLDETSGVRDGVWAGVIRLGSRTLPAAVSIGDRPTYYGTGGARLLEAYILDFAEDIYGKHLVVELIEFVRDQRRFRGSDELIAQMQRDVDSVHRWASKLALRAPRVANSRSFREWHRERRIAAAVREAAKRGNVSHQIVAEIASVPISFVRWAHPTLAELVSEGDRFRD